MDTVFDVAEAAQYNKQQRENFQPLLVSAHESQGQAALSFPLIF